MKNPAVEAINRLKELQQEHALGSLQFPKPDLYSYGVMVGTYQGYERAIIEIQNALSAGDAADAKL